MDYELPYKISYSEGGIKCKRCRHGVPKGKVCIAIMMQSDEDDCHYPEWYHQKCFFELRLPPTQAAFDGFALLRYKDQEAVTESLGLLEIETETESVAVPNFGIEYAKSARDMCNGCNQQIQIGEVRIMKVIRDENHNAVYDGKATWYHALCFARLRSELNWWYSADTIPGFKRLAEEDKKVVTKQIPLMRCEAKKIESRSKIGTVELEKQIKSQNKEYYEVYDFLKQTVSEQDRKIILRRNAPNLMLSEFNEEQILHHLTDIIHFGVPKACTKCRKGEMIFDNTTYKCSSYADIWTKCDNRENTPLRNPVFFYQTILKSYPKLKEFTDRSRDRVLHEFRTTDEHGNDLVFCPYKKPPLFNMEFVIIGRLIMSSREIEQKIRKLGGKIGYRIHAKLAAIISTEEEVQNMNKLMKEAKDFNIQVVSENFLREVMEEADPILYIISRSICDWGGDPYARIDDNDVKTRRETIFYTKSLPEKVTYKWKDGTAVDPECGLAENAHVYWDKNGNNKKYSVILGLVDIQSNKNSYYRMQLLESNDQQLYWLFESWGRISTVIGNKRLKNYGKLIEARKRFEEVYLEKTGNGFGHKQFRKKPNKFYHLDIVFDIPKKIAGSLIKTNLNPSVYQLMEMLFDIKKMETMMTSCDLDLKQMPLGKISESQIKLAMTTLNEISQHITNGGCSIGQLQNLSNKFYTLIPHSFGIERPPLIASVDVINAKNEMLESLLNMELIYGFLNEENGAKINPLDACYKKLKAQIIPLDKRSTDYVRILTAVQQTHGVTHNMFQLEVMDIFKVVREGEEERFNAFNNQFPNLNDNRMLLWHGSRLMNFVNILTNGLKVAPPEAAHTGYMFGKGIYFADSVSKSANYCHTTTNNETALMLLCEVQLGVQRDVFFAQDFTNIPNVDFQSVKGNGIFSSRNWHQVDGLQMAMGQLLAQNIRTSLYYNEYIVYNPAQVKIKYLCKVKFIHR